MRVRIVDTLKSNCVFNVDAKERPSGAVSSPTSSPSLSPDGKRFATGGTYRDGGQVLLWDTNSRRIEHTFDEPATSRCSCVVHFSSDTRLLAYAVEREYMSDSLEVRNVVDGDNVYVLEPRKGNTRCTRFSPDNTRLAACGVCIQIWDLATSRPSLEIKYRAHSLEWSKDGVHVIACNFTNGQLMMYDARAGTQVRTWRDRVTGCVIPPHLWPYNCMSVSPDGRYLASVRGSTVSVWDLENAREVARYAFPREMLCVTFSPNGEFIAAGAYICTIPKMLCTPISLLFSSHIHISTYSSCVLIRSCVGGKRRSQCKVFVPATFRDVCLFGDTIAVTFCGRCPQFQTLRSIFVWTCVRFVFPFLLSCSNFFTLSSTPYPPLLSRLDPRHRSTTQRGWTAVR